MTQFWVKLSANCNKLSNLRKNEEQILHDALSFRVFYSNIMVDCQSLLSVLLRICDWIRMDFDIVNFYIVEWFVLTINWLSLHQI